MSLIVDEGGKSIRMAHLATVGSHAINGVAALHSNLLKASVLKDFYEMWPERFSNKTNGVTPRRFLALANPGLCALLNDTLGEQWPAHLGLLRELEAKADDAAFQQKWRAIKQGNKKPTQFRSIPGISGLRRLHYLPGEGKLGLEGQ